jgi:hypothetical protein
MSAPKVDVLADLRGVVRIARAASVGIRGNTPRIERAEQAIAVVDELIASLPALIDIVRGRAPVALGVIRRTEDALARVGGAK